MFGLEINDSVIVAQQKVLEQALSTNPHTQKALQRLIREVIMEARAQTVRGIGSALQSDPRETRRAVRTAVYKKILGANINIYNSRRAHGSTNYEPARTLTAGQRGGNRRPRGSRTQSMMHYAPLDRGMILRWINAGTSDRTVPFTTNEHRKADRWNHNPNTGNRGHIAPRNFFRSSAESALVRAADTLANLIDTELENILNKTK